MTDDKPKKKRVMTQEMLESLKTARIKALEVRARLKSSESEQIAHAKEKLKNKADPPKGKKERIKAIAEAEIAEELNKLKIEKPDRPPSPDPTPPILDQKEPKEVKEKTKVKELKEKKNVVEDVEEITPPKTENVKVKKEKKIKYIVESSSEEEEEIIYVKKKKNVERKAMLPIDIEKNIGESPRQTHREAEPTQPINYGFQRPMLLREPPRRKSYY